MRMAFVFSAVFLALAFVAPTFARPNVNRPAEPLGIIVQATRSQGELDSEFEGATVFSGDRFVTSDNKSLMRIRLLNSEIVLANDSAVDVQGLPNKFSVNLTSGTAKISTNQNARFQLTVDGIKVQPMGAAPVNVTVTLVNATRVRLASHTALLEISMGDEVKTVGPGSYQLDIAAELSSDAAGKSPDALHGGTSHFTVTVIVLTAIWTGVAIWLSLMSPCKP